MITVKVHNSLTWVTMMQDEFGQQLGTTQCVLYVCFVFILHMRQWHLMQEQEAGGSFRNSVTHGKASQHQGAYLEWIVNRIAIKQWGFQVTLSSVPASSRKRLTHKAGGGVDTGHGSPHSETICALLH